MPKTTTAAKLPRLTVANCARFLELKQERLELERQARALATEERQLAELMLIHTRAAGGMLKKGKLKLAIEQKPGSVSWKSEFIRVAGADAANKLIAAAPVGERLVVS